MLEVGQVFNKNGYVFCVLEIIDYNSSKYALMSVEKEKLEYLFYEIINNEVGYKLKKVVDEQITFSLFEIVEKSKE